MTVEKLIDELDKAVKMPGVSNAWTMPIKARIDMLSTMIRTPVGIKVLGPKLEEIQRMGEHLESVLKEVPGTRNIYAERVTGGTTWISISAATRLRGMGLRWKKWRQFWRTPSAG